MEVDFKIIGNYGGGHIDSGQSMGYTSWEGCGLQPSGVRAFPGTDDRSAGASSPKRRKDARYHLSLQQSGRSTQGDDNGHPGDMASSDLSRKPAFNCHGSPVLKAGSQPLLAPEGAGNDGDIHNKYSQLPASRMYSNPVSLELVMSAFREQGGNKGPCPPLPLNTVKNVNHTIDVKSNPLNKEPFAIASLSDGCQQRPQFFQQEISDDLRGDSNDNFLCSGLVPTGLLATSTRAGFTAHESIEQPMLTESVPQPSTCSTVGQLPINSNNSLSSGWETAGDQPEWIQKLCEIQASFPWNIPPMHILYKLISQTRPLGDTLHRPDGVVHTSPSGFRSYARAGDNEQSMSFARGEFPFNYYPTLPQNTNLPSEEHILSDEMLDLVARLQSENKGPGNSSDYLNSRVTPEDEQTEALSLVVAKSPDSKTTNPTPFPVSSRPGNQFASYRGSPGQHALSSSADYASPVMCTLGPSRRRRTKVTDTRLSTCRSFGRSSSSSLNCCHLSEAREYSSLFGPPLSSMTSPECGNSLAKATGLRRLTSGGGFQTGLGLSTVGLASTPSSSFTAPGNHSTITANTTHNIASSSNNSSSSSPSPNSIRLTAGAGKELVSGDLLLQQLPQATEDKTSSGLAVSNWPPIGSPTFALPENLQELLAREAKRLLVQFTQQQQTGDAVGHRQPKGGRCEWPSRQPTAMLDTVDEMTISTTGLLQPLQANAWLNQPLNHNSNFQKMEKNHRLVEHELAGQLRSEYQRIMNVSRFSKPLRSFKVNGYGSELNPTEDVNPRGSLTTRQDFTCNEVVNPATGLHTRMSPQESGTLRSGDRLHGIHDSALRITTTLTPVHLRKAKLMFFYARYPNSTMIKQYFPDVRFYKNNTAQLVKWFSNFREFYYIQIEKYARAAVSEGVRKAEDIHIATDSELYRALNLHYNRNQQFEVPDHFRTVVKATLQEFFNVIRVGKDAEQSWKKPIYKIIARMDQSVPEFFKFTNWMDQLADS